MDTVIRNGSEATATMVNLEKEEEEEDVKDDEEEEEEEEPTTAKEGQVEGLGQGQGH
jgi:hypothetical protein